MDKIFKKHVMNLEKSNLELTEKRVRLQDDVFSFLQEHNVKKGSAVKKIIFFMILNFNC